MQILSCSGALGTCCTDHGLVLIIDIVRRVIGLMQIAVPIILVIWATVELMQLVMNPEEKKGIKKLINKFISAAVVFLLPVFINITMGLIGDKFSITSCWNQAKSKAELARQTSKYINPNGDEKTTSILPKPGDYDPGVKTTDNSGTGTTNTGTTSGTAVEQAVVAYAKSFVGGKYCKGGTDPHKCADCTGFARYVLNHFNGSGKKIGSTGLPNKSDPHPETFIEVSAKELRGGDIIAYPHHFAIATGNGKEIVHAANRKDGIIISKSYAFSKVDGFYRFKYLTLK